MMSYCVRRTILALLVLGACLFCAMPRAGESAQYGHITEMALRATPSNYAGVCPAVINFHGFIRVDGPNTVIYAIRRSDGGSGEGRQTLRFAGAGSKPVHFAWRVGQRGEHYRGWAQIGSGNARSDRAEFEINCR